VIDPEHFPQQFREDVERLRGEEEAGQRRILVMRCLQHGQVLSVQQPELSNVVSCAEPGCDVAVVVSFEPTAEPPTET
jgi:hypothetical protein